MKEVEYVTIDGKNYIVMDEIELQGDKYTYLINENNKEDFIIRKIVKKDNEEYLEPLSTNEDMYKVLLAYITKNIEF